jgi:hypothetical protein
MTEWLAFLESDNSQLQCFGAVYGIRSFGLDRKIPTIGNSGFIFYLWRCYDLNGRNSRVMKSLHIDV